MDNEVFSLKFSIFVFCLNKRSIFVIFFYLSMLFFLDKCSKASCSFIINQSFNKFPFFESTLEDLLSIHSNSLSFEFSLFEFTQFNPIHIIFIFVDSDTPPIFCIAKWPLYIFRNKLVSDFFLKIYSKLFFVLKILNKLSLSLHKSFCILKLAFWNFLFFFIWCAWF